MKKKPKAKKRNPQDSTTRNVRAANKRIAALEKKLAFEMKDIWQAIAALEERNL